MRTPRRLLMILGVFLVLLYVVNAVVYQAWAAMFALNGWVAALAVGGMLGLLSATFVLSTFLGTRYYNAFTRAYYKLSAVWVGTLVYLFLASAAYSIATTLAGTLVPEVGFVLMAGAVLVSAYGYYNARRIVVRPVQVALANLPEAWCGRRLVFISDVHLGQIYNERRVENIVEVINAQRPDLVCIGGDLFDGTTAPDIKKFAAPLAGIKAPLGTYFITGNHEEYGDANAFMAAIRAAGVRVLEDELVDVEGVQLVGVDYTASANKDAFRAILERLSIDTQKPAILLRHEPKDVGVGEQAGISLQLSGHTHLGQQWPFAHVVRMTYKQFAYGLSTFGRMQVYTSSGVSTWGPPIRVGTRSEVVVLTFKGV